MAIVMRHVVRRSFARSTICPGHRFTRMTITTIMIIHTGMDIITIMITIIILIPMRIIRTDRKA